jgi:hypothetical protein
MEGEGNSFDSSDTLRRTRDRLDNRHQRIAVTGYFASLLVIPPLLFLALGGYHCNRWTRIGALDSPLDDRGGDLAVGQHVVLDGIVSDRNTPHIDTLVVGCQ